MKSFLQFFHLYDEARQQWRTFQIVPPETFQPACRNGLHQASQSETKCACGKFTRNHS